MADEQARVWILGATGRIGRELAPRIAARTELVPVLAGRDPARLAEASAGLNGAGRTIVAASASAMVGQIRRRPAIVVNLLGGYADTAAMIARACMPAGTTSILRPISLRSLRCWTSTRRPSRPTQPLLPGQASASWPPRRWSRSCAQAAPLQPGYASTRLPPSPQRPVSWVRLTRPASWTSWPRGDAATRTVGSSASRWALACSGSRSPTARP
jgi:hypothetical protein